MRAVVYTVNKYVGTKCLGIIVDDLCRDVANMNGKWGRPYAVEALRSFLVPMDVARDFVSGLTVEEAMQIKKEA